MPEADGLFAGHLSTAEALSRLRKRLLDLTTRNRLLSFRWTRGRVVRVVDAPLDDLYTALREGGILRFKPVPEPRREDYVTDGSSRRKPDAPQFAESQGINPSFDLDQRSKGLSGQIQTLLYPDDLERVLRNIDRAGRTAIEESGANMLYLVFGFLQWFDSEEAQEPRHAPLITMPVMLKRIRHHSSFVYEVSHNGEDIADNLTLREKLKQDFSLALPELEDEALPSDYIAQVAKLARVKVEPPWRVSPQVSLGLLSFGNLLMYLDLDPNRWPKGMAIDQGSLVKGLFEGTDVEAAVGGEAAVYPVEEDPRAVRLSLVFDADSSQHSALVDAMEGKNLVVEGPPGTGKSQTISNLIAAALTDGKTVLFVAEKLAALEVVRDRLDRAGLGSFCLELHSNKTQKRRMLDDIAERLFARGRFPNPHELESKRKELDIRRSRLKQYADLMNSVTHNELDLTAHQVLWAAERNRRALGAKVTLLSGEEYAASRNCSYPERERLKEAAHNLAEHRLAIGCDPQAHPWFGYYPFKLILGDEPALVGMVGGLAEAASQLESDYSLAHQGLGSTLPPTRHAVASLKSRVASVPLPSDTDAIDLLPDMSREGANEILRDFAGRVRSVRERLPILDRTMSNPTRLGQGDIDIAQRTMVEAESVNATDTPHSDLHRRAQALAGISSELRKACEFFNAVARRVGFEESGTKEGLGRIWGGLQAAIGAPVELLRYRRPELAEPATPMLVEQASRRAASLRERQDGIQKWFDLRALPPHEELVAALRAMRTRSGLLRIFGSEWRKAARTYRSIRLLRPWILRSTQCEGELQALIAYLDDKAVFESDAELRRTLGDLFKGIDTELVRLKQLSDWYAQARNAFERVGWPAELTRFMTVPVDAVRDLALSAPDGKRHWEIIETFRDRVRAVFRDSCEPHALAEEGPTIADEAARIQAVARTFDKIAGVLDTYLVDPASPRELVAFLHEYAAVIAARNEVELSAEARTLLGVRFRGLNTDFGPIDGLVDWIRHLRRAELPSGFEKWLLCPQAATNLNSLRAALDRVEQGWESIEAATAAFSRFGTLDWEAWQRGHATDVRGISDRVKRAIAGLEGIWKWVGFSQACRTVDEMNLTQLCALVLNGQLAGEEIRHAFEFLFHNSIARAILRDNPALVTFSGVSHEQLRTAFQELDRAVIKLNGARCAHVIDQRAHAAPRGVGSGSPKKDYTEMHLITHEIQKKRAHIPIRQLVNRAGRALQQLKPCFMMGPLSVAQYLEPGNLRFDLIIMDEASQVRPEEAIGALARGGQMVIVGDPKQLPPTSFFDRFWEGSDGEEEQEETAAEGMESILNLCLSRFHPPRQLQWHYRSQHEALIHFSNKEFYDSKLIIFPSAFGSQAGLGLRHHYVAKGVFENRRNVEEARRVADAVIQHFTTRPDESLGVATLNIPQRDLIEEEIDRRLRSHPEAERFIERWKGKGLMPFFVKNLENVQGDERDVIFISTTYGRNREGVVAQRFGPINQGDGWRRLNVLFTRARKRIELFTSLDPGDIIVDAQSSRGVRALHDYLAYVSTGISEGPTVSGREPDSDFEVAVADVLRNAGYQVVPQLGVAGFFIDIAVRNPSRPGEYIAAIECDGASYHSARSVRERDRLREEILEGKGWKGRIHRIWSTDWFRDPASQIKRLLMFLEEARGQADAKARGQVQEAQVQSPSQTSAPKVTDDPAVAETFGVRIGDWVTFSSVGTPGQKKKVRIVRGASASEKAFLGSHTPLAQALLGAQIGDEVELSVKGYSPQILRVLDIDTEDSGGSSESAASTV